MVTPCPGIGEWGYCSADCPSDSGYPASGAGPACQVRSGYASIQTQYSCQVRTTGYGYPAHCAAEHAKDHKNILFIGNSYTYGNDLPGMVKNLASAAGGFSMSPSD